MTERRGTKALELWCRRITDGYPGVSVQNMTTSWRDGLAFCAMIHHFRPDLIDFNSLNKDDVYGNNELAFRTAAEHLGIPALLDAEDMASCSVPDRLSILTYLSQFYQNFGGSSPSRLALSRTKESTKEGIAPVSPTTPTKPKMGPRTGIRREPCAACGMPVFLAEKLLISRTPYHRTCFRCARCSNQLTPGNYYETEEGQYCCETCPDEEEEENSVQKPVLDQAYNETPAVDVEESKKIFCYKPGYQLAPLSDEEKTERIQERGIPRSTSDEMRRDCLVAEKKSNSAQIRLNFMTKNFLEERLDDESKGTSIGGEEDRSDTDGIEEEEEEAGDESISSPPGGNFRKRRVPEGSPRSYRHGEERVETADTPLEFTDDLGEIDVEPDVDKDGCGACVAAVEERNRSDDLDDRLVDKDARLKESFDNATSERYRGSSSVGKEDSSGRQDTKDTLGPDIGAVADTSQCLSLVQRRLRMFENSPIEDTKISSLPTGINNEKNNSVFTEKLTSTRINDVDPRTIEEVKSLENNSETSVMEDESVPSLPPVVPKRTAPELRKAGRCRKIDTEITVLNATGIDLSAEENYPKDLNPFGSDEEEASEEKSAENLETSRSDKVSTNPFGSSDEDEEDDGPRPMAPPRPAARTIGVGNKWREESRKDMDDEAPTKRKLKAPQINLNPFWSDDDEDHESDDEGRGHSLTSNTPVPKPRTIKQSPESFLSQRKNDFHRGDIYASNSSLGSTGSASTPGGTYRKKKPAPPPPIANEMFTSGTDSMLTPNRGSNTFTGSNNSLRTTPRTRKAKPAPPPPMPTSTPCSTNLIANLTLTESPITDSGKILESRDYETWDVRKIGKDEANRSKQSMTTISCDETNPYGGYTDKSVQGKWKRKKGPAPARPIPHRRKIKVMSLKDVKLELDEIEMQQQGLEKQGVRLEQLIRDKAESGNATDGAESNLEIDVEELVLELFALVNEKNELFRRQAELMLLRRQQRLEEEHADIEYQIRCLLCQPEAMKTDFDKQREETLIQRLVDIVERRNEIVECLEMDRRREVEEDRSINTRMGLYAAKTKSDFAKEMEDDENNCSRKSKKSKLKEKAKEKILRKVHKKDADKDVDEAEAKLKRQNKRKWF